MTDTSRWRCPQCSSRAVWVSMPAWFRDTAAGLTFVEADSGASISAWYCETCNQSGSGQPIQADSKRDTE